MKESEQGIAPSRIAGARVKESEQGIVLSRIAGARLPTAPSSESGRADRKVRYEKRCCGN